jgi:serine/threonine protein kinase
MPEALLSGSELIAGRYRLEKVLGMGGMGYVVSALEIGTDRQLRRVAIKFMLPDALKSPTLHRRFVREAEAIGRLRGDHVCRLLETGSLPDGSPFMVMEYLSGEDLDRVVASRGPLPVWETADYALQVIDAIAEAHSQGIIHRDLKPANVFRAWAVDGRALIKVLDFGVAKAADGLQSTGTNTVMGSPSFMAPEQIVSSKRVDERADVYSIGAILYYLLTGQLPFEADQLPALCLMVLNEDPIPPILHRPDLPREIDEIILTCMAREPAHRFPNVADLAYALVPHAPERCRPLATAAARSLNCDPATWRRPPSKPGTTTGPTRVIGQHGANGQTDRTERSELGDLTDLTESISQRAPTVNVRRGSVDGGATTERAGLASNRPLRAAAGLRRRPAWLTAAVAAICIALGAIGAVFLANRLRSEPADVGPALEPEQTANQPEPAAPPPAVDQARPAAAPAAPAPALDEAVPDEVASTPVEPAESRKPARARRQRASQKSSPSRPGEAAPGNPRPPPCAVDDPLCAFGTAR